MENQNIISFLLFFYSSVVLAVSEANITSCNSEADNSGCIIVSESLNNPSDGNLQIYYRWLNKPDFNKKTFIFLNGGPGGSFDVYFNAKDFWLNSVLSKNYNILFFDPRGVGRSSPITQENFELRNIQNYQIANLIEDIESLRKALVPNQKIGLIGHSFGGHLLFSYAIKYSENLFNLISLHGGVSGLGFVSQSYFQNKEWIKVIDGINPLKLSELKSKIERGEACSVPDEKPLPSDIWSQLQTIAYVGTFEQRQQLPSLLKLSIQLNIDENKICTGLNKNIGFNKLNKATNQGLNVYANRAIVCSSLLTKTQIMNSATIFHDEATRKMEKQCKDFSFLGVTSKNNFNLIDQLKKIEIPMLIVGASNDQMISPITQFEIWDNLDLTQKNISKLHILSNCGHNSILECGVALEGVISSFIELK